MFTGTPVMPHPLRPFSSCLVSNRARLARFWMAECSSEQMKLWGLPSRRQKRQTVTLTLGREKCCVGKKGRNWTVALLAQVARAVRMLGSRS